MTKLPYWIAATVLICGVAVIASGAGDEGPKPDLNGAVAWLNSPPLSKKALRGKVVLVNFWTYSCINSLRELPYMKAWAAKYKDAGLVVIGVHAPEFGFEKDPANVKNAVSDLKVAYPIPIDSDHAIWQAFRNEYWPADYFVDANGRVKVSEVFHAGAPGAQFQPEGTSNRVGGRAPDHASYLSYATFRDPDGNGWLLQEVTTRLPARIDRAETAFASANDLASALRRAEAAHGQHEKRTGERDANWPDWYAEYMVAEQAGKELPQ